MRNRLRVAKPLVVVALLLAVWAQTAPAQEAARTPVSAVTMVGMTVADMDRSVDFYSRVLAFEKVSDVEVAGPDYERLQGVFGLRMRVVRMRLGDEQIELTEYLAPRGRPIPMDSRSHDRWFQHIAVIVSDMDRAYRWLRQNRVEHASTGPQRLPDWNENAGGIRAFYFGWRGERGAPPRGAHRLIGTREYPGRHANRGASRWRERARWGCSPRRDPMGRGYGWGRSDA